MNWRPMNKVTILSLQEMKRVLKASGRLIFVEHGRAPDTGVSVWQDRLTPVWKRIGGGCHLNRRIDELIRKAGFDIPFVWHFKEGPFICLEKGTWNIVRQLNESKRGEGGFGHTGNN